MCIWLSKKSQTNYSCNKYRRLSNRYIKILSVHSLTFFSPDVTKSFNNMQRHTNIHKTISLNFSAVYKVHEKEMGREDGERKTGFYTAGIWQSLSLIAWSKIQPRGNKIKMLLYDWQSEGVHRFLTRKWRRAGGKGKKWGKMFESKTEFDSTNVQYTDTTEKLIQSQETLICCFFSPSDTAAK